MYRLLAAASYFVGERPANGDCPIDRIALDAGHGEKYIRFCPNSAPGIFISPAIIMVFAKRFRPISFLNINTVEVAKELAEKSGTIVFTQNGVPSFVCVSYEDYYQLQETNALLKLVSMVMLELRPERTG